jgi:hypothetical protein
MLSILRHSMMTKPTVLALGLAGMLACSSDQPTTAPDAATADLQSSSTPITVTIAPMIDGSVRDGNNAIDNSVVQTLHVPSFEDRGIIEFNLRKFSGPVLRATLRLTVYGSKGPYPIRVDLYGYRGNGRLEADDWDRGTFISSFEYAGEHTIVLDVTAKVRAMKSNGAVVAGFNFRAEPSDIDDNGPFVAFNSNEYPPRAILNIRTYAAP